MTTPHTHTWKNTFTVNTSNSPVIHSASILFLSPLPSLILFSFALIPPPPPVSWQLQGLVTKWVCVSYCLSRKWNFRRWMERFSRRNAILRKWIVIITDFLSLRWGSMGDGFTLPLLYLAIYPCSLSIYLDELITLHTRTTTHFVCPLRSFLISCWLGRIYNNPEVHLGKLIQKNCVC